VPIPNIEKRPTGVVDKKFVIKDHKGP
jgi:hypothetical protein